MHQKIILVDRQDREIGSKEKIAVHYAEELHTAFSILVLNSKRELLMQRRAPREYHSSMLWSNTCCGHPRPGQEVMFAAHRG